MWRSKWSSADCSAVLLFHCCHTELRTNGSDIWLMFAWHVGAVAESWVLERLDHTTAGIPSDLPMQSLLTTHSEVWVCVPRHIHITKHSNQYILTLQCRVFKDQQLLMQRKAAHGGLQASTSMPAELPNTCKPEADPPPKQDLPEDLLLDAEPDVCSYSTEPERRAYVAPEVFFSSRSSLAKFSFRSLEVGFRSKACW